MRLEDTLRLASLSASQMRQPKIITRTVGVRELADIVFANALREGRDLYDTKGAWIKRNLFSKKFSLIRANAYRLADPLHPPNPNLVSRLIAEASGGLEPIVVDFNKDGIGKIGHLGFVPKAIVVDGREKHAAIKMIGEPHIMAWVGEEVLDYVKAEAGIGIDELAEKLKFKINTQISASHEEEPVIERVFPFEHSFIYRYGERKYKQNFNLSGNRNVTFVGRPKEITVDEINACGCGAKITAKKYDEIQCKAGVCMSFTKGETAINLKAAFMSYKKAGGGKALIHAVSPPGFEETTEHMKDHPEIDNPFALAWWMYKEGYTPHKGKI